MHKTDWHLQKRPTGIPGLDRLTHGGLPHGQATLVLGESGTGKTVLGLQILANAVAQGDGGVFATFEESLAQLRRNADSFSWGSTLTESGAWSAIDTRTAVGAEFSGEFDIDALLGAISAQADRFENPWIVIDGIDQLLQHQPDPVVAINQVRQINEHCEKHGWTLLLSGKVEDRGLSPRHLDGIEFLLPTVLMLTATVVDRRLNRQIRVAKYRGSSHVTDVVPLIMNDFGVQLPYQSRPVPAAEPPAAGMERVSTGINRLDKLLGDGPYRGSSTLISGRPGTAKSTLAASFAASAAERGERTLYISFDEVEAPYVRNLKSVGIDLRPQIDADRIRFRALSTWSALISEHFLHIQELIEEFEPHCLVIDPVSALLNSAGPEGTRAVIERFLDIARSRGITTVMTSLTGENDPEGETTLAHVSTIADTWIVLDYNVRAGERNRSLSIVKSRGTAHSNQQRELVLSDDGIDLADVYEYGTEVLMGTARAHKESEDGARTRRIAMEREHLRQDLQRRIELACSESDRLKAELELQEQESDETEAVDRRHTEKMKRRREPGSSPEEEGGKK